MYKRQVGYFLIIIIKIAKTIGIENAARFPDNSPGVSEFPTINTTPVKAKIIEVKVVVLISVSYTHLTLPTICSV